MKIYFESGGGFVGLVRSFECDSESLPPEYRDTFSHWVQSSDSFKADYAPTEPYRILRVDQALRQIEWRFGDTVPPHLESFFQFLESRAIPKTHKKKT